MMFDFPQPFGPTTAQRLEGNGTVVGSTNDLKPASLIACNRIKLLHSTTPARTIALTLVEIQHFIKNTGCAIAILAFFSN
jgi:hypothetical protein